jgi:uncharacterized protein YkwD
VFESSGQFGAIVAAQHTYSPYRRGGRPIAKPAGFGRTPSPRRSALSQALLPPEASDLPPARRSLSSGGRVSRGPSLAGLVDPAARRWVVLGALGIVSSLLLTIAVALLSNRGTASADVPPADAARAAARGVTVVREIGGAPRSSPTPGIGQVATAPAEPGSATAASAGLGASTGTSAIQSVATTALRQLRKVGRAIVTTDGIRRLALGGAVPFVEAGNVTASTNGAAPAADPHEVAMADAAASADPDVTLGAGSIFLRLADDAGTGAFLAGVASSGQTGVIALASPPAVSATATVRTADVTATPVPATATPVPPTATSVPPTATAVPPTPTQGGVTTKPVTPTPTQAVATATPVVVTATPIVATSTPIVGTATPVVVTATPIPATQTPVIITATPEPTRRPTRTPTPETIVVTATPSSLFPSTWQEAIASGQVPWLNTAATSTPPPAFIMGPPPTQAPTNTPIPTATFYVIPDPHAAPVTAVPAPPTSTPHRPDPTPAGPAPILAETGTRTPINPTPGTTSRTGVPGTGQQQAQAGQPGQGAAGAANVAQAQQPDPAVLEKLVTRALLAVNTARAQAGAMPLARTGALDTASALHAQYDVATGQTEGNFQTRGNALFLGETPGARVARAAAVARSASVDRVAEVMALGETEPERTVQGWLDSVYHRVLVLDLAAQYAGFGQQTAGSATTAVLDLGGKRDVANASGWFPASGATDVPTSCICDDYAEATGKSGPFGYPVTLLLGQVRPQGMPTVARLSENDENGPGVVAELVDAYGNPTLLPQQPLKPNTKYVVQMAWANGPSVSWGFTTASQ